MMLTMRAPDLLPATTPCRRQLAGAPAEWDPRAVAAVRKRVARCSPQFRLHVLLLQVGAPLYLNLLPGRCHP
jgi:hypothetical protein